MELRLTEKKSRTNTRTSNMMKTICLRITMASAMLLLSLGATHGQETPDCVDQNLEYLHFNANRGITSYENCTWVGEDQSRCNIQVTREPVENEFDRTQEVDQGLNEDSNQGNDQGNNQENNQGRPGKNQKNSKARRLAKNKNTKAGSGSGSTETTETLRNICPFSCGVCSTTPVDMETELGREVALSVQKLTVEEKNNLDLTPEEMKEVNQSKRSHDKHLRKKKKNRKPCPCPEGGHSGDDDDDDDDDSGSGSGDGDGGDDDLRPTDAPSETAPIGSPTGSPGTPTTDAPTASPTQAPGNPLSSAPTSATTSSSTFSFSSLTTSSGSFSSSSGTTFTGSFSSSFFSSSSFSSSSSFFSSGSFSSSSSFFSSTSTTTGVENASQESSTIKKSTKTLAVFLSIVPVLLLLVVFCCLLRRKRRKAREGKGLDDTDESDDDQYPIHKTKSVDSRGSKNILKVLGFFNGREGNPQTDVHQCASSFCDGCSPPGSPRRVLSVDSYENLYTNSTFKDELDERYVVNEVEC